MSKYLWFRIAQEPHGVFHMVAEDTDQTRTLCGLDVSFVADFRDALGDNRPCDNCTEIAARHEDAGDQPAV
jgi:hypothetical protein